jgi:ligand-binding sensor domain-containing protein
MKRLLAWSLMVALVPTLTAAEWAHFDNNADIRAIHETGDTLWIGTNGGLLVFNLAMGEIAEKITAGPVLPDNSVRAINAVGGSVYVGTDRGLLVIRRGEPVIYEAERSPVFTDIRSIDFSDSGSVYLSTFGHGVGVMENGQRDGTKAGRLVRITRADSLLDNKVFGVAHGDTGGVYFATSLGFCAYRDSAWVSFQAGAGLPRGEVKQLLHAKEDVFYLLIRDRGIYRFNDVRGRRVRTSEGSAAASAVAITLDSTGALWTGGRFGGIARYQGGGWTTFGDADPEIAGARWRCAHTGPSGTVYLGSADGLIARIREGDVQTLRLPSVLPSGFVGPMAEDGEGRRFVVNGSQLLVADAEDRPLIPDTDMGSVFALARAPDGAVWVSTPWGLLRRQGDEWQEVRADIEPRPPVFLSLAFDAGGHLWAGGHNGEVFRFDGDLWVPFAGGEEIGTAPVFRLLVDNRNAVWALTRTGVHRFQGLSWQSFGPEVFDSHDARDAALDSQGRIAVVTDYQLWRYDYRRGFYAVPLDGKRLGRHRTIRFDGEGHYYLGTTDGLIIGGPEGVFRVDPRRGLRGREVTTLLIDSHEVLWVGFRTDGISRIPLESLWQQALSLEDM